MTQISAVQCLHGTNNFIYDVPSGDGRHGMKCALNLEEQNLHNNFKMACGSLISSYFSANLKKMYKLTNYYEEMKHHVYVEVLYQL